MTASLGIDIDGTKIASAVLDHDGTVLDVEATPTTRGGDVILGQISAIVDSFAGKHDLSAVGIAVPGDVNPSTGVIRSAPNIGWSGSMWPSACGCFCQHKSRSGSTTTPTQPHGLSTALADIPAPTRSR